MKIPASWEYDQVTAFLASEVAVGEQSKIGNASVPVGGQPIL
jgi:hypothetical protein